MSDELEEINRYYKQRIAEINQFYDGRIEELRRQRKDVTFIAFMFVGSFLLMLILVGIMGLTGHIQ